MNTYTVGQSVQVIGSYAWGMPGEWSNATVVAIDGGEIEVSFSNGYQHTALTAEIRSI